MSREYNSADKIVIAKYRARVTTGIRMTIDILKDLKKYCIEPDFPPSSVFKNRQV
jgi:hypothetical protein